jgi:hypothetical protein
LAKKEKEGYWQVQMNVNKFATSKILKNEPLGAEGPPLVGEEVRKEDVGKVGS